VPEARPAGWNVEAMVRNRHADSLAFGPQTCGCVALIAHADRFTHGCLREAPRAWPLCPHCSGLGVDRRIGS